MIDEMNPRVCVVLGGGGHARVLMDSLQSTPGVRLHGVLDPNPSLWGTMLQDVPILGGDDLLSALADHGVRWFVVGVGGTGDNRPRQRLFELALANSLTPVTAIDPRATVSRWSRIGEGCQVLPGSIVNAGAELGRNVIANSGSIIEHDCRIGDHVHVAPGAILAAAVHVGPLAHVGAGATIRQGIRVGSHAVVGAGAVVVKDVAQGQIVAGVPARPIVR